MTHLKPPAFTLRPDARWKNLRYRQINFSDDKIVHYRDALHSLYVNGRVDFAAFEAVDRDAFFSAWQHDHQPPATVVEDLLTQNDVVRGAFPNGQMNFSHQELQVIPKGGCEFEGLLADVLLGGGAYYHWQHGVSEAKRLAAECVEGMRLLGPSQVWSPCLMTGPWSQYFYDVAWDYTFVVQFPYDARWFVMCATDTD